MRLPPNLPAPIRLPESGLSPLHRACYVTGMPEKIPNPSPETCVGLIGMGRMAQALAGGWWSRLTPPPSLVGYDPSSTARQRAAQRVPDWRPLESEAAVAEAADVVFLCVKPQAVGSVCQCIAPVVGERGSLVVSIAAGVTLEALSRNLDGHDRLIRIMPNTPCLVGAGASGLAAAEGADSSDRQLVEALMSAVGVCHWLEERLLDAVTGLSGSGPAYVFVLIEALADGGVRMGLPRDVALSLAAQTVYGASKLLLEEQQHPAVLKDQVASPGGTTIAGLEAVEQYGVRGAMMAAVRAATERAHELNDPPIEPSL